MNLHHYLCLCQPRLLWPLFRKRAVLRVCDQLSRLPSAIGISLLLGHLMTSRNVEFSRMILFVLESLPEAQIQQHPDLGVYFGLMGASGGSARDGIQQCRHALDLCFRCSPVI